MRIDRIVVRELRMPLREGFETSFGRIRTREMLIVALFSEGLTGWGEAPVALRPHFSEETTATARHVLRDFIGPAIVGAELGSVAQLLARFAWVRGHRMARAAVEAAFRDLLARRDGRSLASSLGAERDRIPVGVSLGIPEGAEVPRLLAEVERRIEEGYCRVKVKIRPGFDTEPLERLRMRFPALDVAADANGAYRLEDYPRLQALDEARLLFLEQPLGPDDLCEHARLRSLIRTPVCLDESLKTACDVQAALALEACAVVNLKPARVGGIAAALAVHDICRRKEVPLFCGGMLETGIGRAHNVALAALDGFTLAGDLSASDRYYAEDLVEPPFRLGPGGTLEVPRGPGIGVEVVSERLARATVALDEIAPGAV